MSESSRLPYGIDPYPPRKREKAGRYRVRIFYEGQQHHVGIFDTITDAKAALNKARGEKAENRFVPPAAARRERIKRRLQEKSQRVTVKEWSDRWIKDLEGQGRSGGTIATYKSALRKWILPMLGQLRLSDIDEDVLDGFRVTVEESGTSWPNVGRATRAMLNAAVESSAGGLTSVPRMRGFTSRRVSKSEDASKVATLEEVESLEAAMPPELAVAVPIAAWGALRLSEVLGLTRNSFRGLGKPGGAVPTNATVIVSKQWASKTKPPQYTPPKAGSAGEVAIPAFVAVKVRDHLATYVDPSPNAPVFPSSLDRSRPISHTAFTRWWNQARDEVRPGYRFHSLRHTALTRAAQAGATLAELQRRGRHADASTALRYQQAEDSRDRAIADALDVLMREGDTPGTELTGV